jgi:hypothetical protein
MADGAEAKDWCGSVPGKDGTIYAWHRSEGRGYADGSWSSSASATTPVMKPKSLSRMEYYRDPVSVPRRMSTYFK